MDETFKTLSRHMLSSADEILVMRYLNTKPTEWGRILRWREDSFDNRPTIMIVDGRVVSDTEQVAAYLATQAILPAGAQEGSRLAWLGPRTGCP
mgnify:CR=1 FL=1